MCLADELQTVAHRGFRDELIGAGLLIPLGVAGVYGRGGAFERVVEQFEHYLSRTVAPLAPEVLRFPPLLSRAHYLCTDHIQNFPNLMGSVHSFAGNDRGHLALLQKRERGEDWTGDL